MALFLLPATAESADHSLLSRLAQARAQVQSHSRSRLALIEKIRKIDGCTPEQANAEIEALERSFRADARLNVARYDTPTA